MLLKPDDAKEYVSRKKRRFTGRVCSIRDDPGHSLHQKKSFAALLLGAAGCTAKCASARKGRDDARLPAGAFYVSDD